MKAAASRIGQLRKQIDQHNYLYHVLDSPEVSDAAYDDLLKELRAIEAEHPELVTPDSPTQRVGATPSSAFSPVTHGQAMLSLENAFDAADVTAFDARARQAAGGNDVAYVAEPKLDGLAVNLIYENGQLARAATRGDGGNGRGHHCQYPHHTGRTAGAAWQGAATSRSARRSLHAHCRI